MLFTLAVADGHHRDVLSHRILRKDTLKYGSNVLSDTQLSCTCITASFCRNRRIRKENREEKLTQETVLAKYDKDLLKSEIREVNYRTLLKEDV